MSARFLFILELSILSFSADSAAYAFFDKGQP
jgi:hypothetical protein